MKKILITGGGGYIGSHAVKLFLEKGFPVVVIDNFLRGYHEPLEILKKYGDIFIEEADLLDAPAIKKIFEKHDIAEVVHFAALCSVNESVEEPERYLRNNVEGTRNLLEAMLSVGVKNIIFSSTCAVYGETKILPVDEMHPTNPVNPYGESKLAAENLIREYREKHDFHFVIFRYFNVCGAAGNGVIGDSKKPSPHLLQNAVRGAMGISPFFYTCATVDTPDGTPIRDYVDVEDLVRAHYLGYQYLVDGGESETFNLGNGRGYSVKEIVSETEKSFGTTIEKSQDEPRKGEYAWIYANPNKAKEILAFTPEKSLANSIESLRLWYTGHPQGYDE